MWLINELTHSLPQSITLSTCLAVLIEITYLLVIGLMIAMMAKRSSASFKHAVLSLTLGLCLLVPVFVLCMPRWQSPALASGNSQARLHRVVSAQLPARELHSADQQARSFSSRELTDSRKSDETFAASNPVSAASVRRNSVEQVASAGTAARQSQVKPLGWLFLIWSVGAFVAFVPLLIGNVQKRWLLSKATAVNDPVWERRLQRSQEQLGKPCLPGRRVQLYVVDNDMIPLTWGCLRPVILLPKNSEGWSEQRCRAVLLHELAHVKRFDFPIQVLARIACGCFWFHPLAWAILNRMRIEREFACDDCVVRTGQKPTAYASELVSIAETCRNLSRRELGLAMARNTNLKSRVESLFDKRRSHRPVGRVLGWTMVLFFTTSTALMAGYDGIRAWQEQQDSADSVSSVDSIGDPLPVGALMRFGSMRFQHPATATNVTVSGNQKTVISLNHEFVIGWDASSGKQLWKQPTQIEVLGRNQGWRFSAAEYGTHPIAFIPDSNKFYFPGSKNSISIWDANTGKREEMKLDTSTLEEWTHNSPFKSVAVSPEGDRIALGNADSLLVCDSKGRAFFCVYNNPMEDIQTIDEPTEGTGRMGGGDRMGNGGEFSYAQFLPDDDRIAVVNSEFPKLIRLFEVSTGEEVGRIETKHRVVRMGFTSFGDRVVVTERDSSVRMYDVATGDRVWSTEFEIEQNAENYTTDVVIDPNGKFAAVGAPLGSQSHIRVVSLETGDELAILKGHTWKPWTLSLTEDGKRMYSSGWDGSILQWDMNKFEQIQPQTGERATGISCGSPVNNQVAYVTHQGQIKIADSVTGKEIRSIDAVGYGDEKISFSPDGKLIAAGGVNDKQTLLSVWNVETGKQVQQWQWAKGRDPHSQVTGLSFSPDCKKIAASVFRQNAAYLFDVESGEQISEVRHAMVYGCSFDATGSRLTTVGWDSTIQSWAIESGAPIPNGKIEMPRGGGGAGDHRTYGIRYSPDRVHFATLQMGAVTKIWKVGQNEPKAKTDARGGVATGCMAYSNDGSLLAIGDRSGKIQIMDSLTAKIILEKQAHSDNMYSLNFSPDGQTLLSGGSEGVSYIWSLRSERKEQQSVIELYDALIGKDAAAAFQARWSLLETPSETIALLSAKLLGETAVDLGDASLRTLAVIHAVGSDESKSLLRSIHERDPNSYQGQQAKRFLDSEK